MTTETSKKQQPKTAPIGAQPRVRERPKKEFISLPDDQKLAAAAKELIARLEEIDSTP